MPKSRGRKKSLNPFNPPSPKQAFHGNAETVDLLQKFLAYAQEGRTCWGGVVLVEPGDVAGYGFAGRPELHPEALRTFQVLASDIEKRSAQRLSGAPDPGKGANYVEYNLATDPINFDFLIWLIDAEMTRRRLGAPWPLRVGFSNEMELAEYGWRFFLAVHKPLLSLVGGIEDPEAIGGFRTAEFTPNPICAAARRGEEVPILEANPTNRDWVKNWLRSFSLKQPVVITLREAEHFGENSIVNRNSNKEEWLKVGRWLRDQGETVIFVRDTRFANEPLEDFVTCPQASFSIQPRMALVEAAKLNLYTSNGPAGLGLFSKSPYLYFMHLKRDDNYEPNNPEWWERANGIGRGGQWPWALPSQRMVWEPDTFENIREAWEQHKHLWSN